MVKKDFTNSHAFGLTMLHFDASMNQLMIALLLLMLLHRAMEEHVSNEEDDANGNAVMHPKPTHRIHMTQFPDHTELYEESASGGIAAYITPDAVQVTSLHLEGPQSGSDGEEGVGLNLARTGVILPRNKKKRERVVRGVGETVGASEEFGRVLERVALSKDEEGEGLKPSQDTAVEEKEGSDVNAKGTEDESIKQEASDQWSESMEESLIHDML
jgi:hypothetical protein